MIRNSAVTVHMTRVGFHFHQARHSSEWLREESQVWRSKVAFWCYICISPPHLCFMTILNRWFHSSSVPSREYSEVAKPISICTFGSFIPFIEENSRRDFLQSCVRKLSINNLASFGTMQPQLLIFEVCIVLGSFKVSGKEMRILHVCCCQGDAGDVACAAGFFLTLVEMRVFCTFKPRSTNDDKVPKKSQK